MLLPRLRLVWSFQVLREIRVPELTIAQNLSEQARANDLARMHWHDSASAVCMAEEVMAAPNSKNREAQPAKRSDKILTRYPGSPGHAATVTR